MKNIAIISTSLHSGGAERIAGLLSKELSKYYNVYLFLLNTEDIVYEYGGTIVDIGRSRPFYEYPIKKNKQRYNIDVAISFLEIMNFANIRTRGSERIIISERCVQSLINPPYTSEIEKIRRYYNFADEIVSCSEGVKYDLINNYEIENQITTIYNFIDKEKIYNMSKDKLPGDVKKFLGLSNFFLNIGRLHHQKNQKRLIMQFKIFHETDNKNMKLIILGSGKLTDELVNYIHELDMDEYIKIYPYTNNPFLFMRNACSLVVSSHYEGLPNVILEAMVLGCPIVSTDCMAGPRELLKGEINYGTELKKIEICKRGILVPDNDSEDIGKTQYMAEAMRMIAGNKELRQTIINNEIKYMETYTNKQLLNKWIEVIEKEDKKSCNVLIREKQMLESAQYIIIYGAGIVGKSCYLRLLESKKFYITKKPGNPNRFLTDPAAPELFDLYAILAVFP